MNIVENLSYICREKPNVLTFDINNTLMCMDLNEYDIPDKDIVFLNTYYNDDVLYFTLDDVPADDTSLYIPWRMISRIISVVLSNNE